MAKDKYDPPAHGGTLTFTAGMSAGEPGKGKTANMQNTMGTRLPNGGAPRRKSGGRRSSGKKGMSY